MCVKSIHCSFKKRYSVTVTPSSKLVLQRKLPRHRQLNFHVTPAKAMHSARGRHESVRRYNHDILAFDSRNYLGGLCSGGLSLSRAYTTGDPSKAEKCRVRGGFKQENSSHCKKHMWKRD